MKLPNYVWYVLIFTVWLCSFERVSSVKGSKEYCLLESFNPTCQSGEITIVQHAVYGRMNRGKCIKSDFYLGCSVNVLEIIDGMCSGSNWCNIPIPNTPMREKIDCLQDASLSAYLEASYICQKVYNPRSKQCRTPEKIKAGKQTQYIASEVSKNTSCGLHGTPWILEAEPGQYISINLTDFAWENKSDESRPNQCVINYGYILDMESDDVVHICGGTNRENHVYTSAGHSLQIVLESNSVNHNKFVLHFYAFGCPEYKPPPHSWIQKENDSVVIGCVASDKQWKLKCVDNRWLGVIGNCTPAPEPSTVTIDVQKPVAKFEKSSEQQIPQVSNNHVIVFTIGCLTLLVCCVVIIVGVYYIKRYNVKIKKYSSSNFNTIASYQNGRMTLGKISTTYRPVNSQQQLLGTIQPPAYTFPLPKEDQGPQVPPRNSIKKGNNVNSPTNQDNNVYENVADDESVQYYILENPAEMYSNGQDKSYQSMHIGGNLGI